MLLLVIEMVTQVQSTGRLRVSIGPRKRRSQENWKTDNYNVNRKNGPGMPKPRRKILRTKSTNNKKHFPMFLFC
ncbi:unnamed protein product [Caenorhabditis nigoni]